MKSYQPVATDFARAALINDTRASDKITELAGHINSATYRFLSLSPSLTAEAASRTAPRSLAHIG